MTNILAALNGKTSIVISEKGTNVKWRIKRISKKSVYLTRVFTETDDRYDFGGWPITTSWTGTRKQVTDRFNITKNQLEEIRQAALHNEHEALSFYKLVL